MSTYEIQAGVGPAAHGYAPDEMSTGARTGAAKLKWVVIVDESLSPGQAVNAAVTAELHLAFGRSHQAGDAAQQG